MPRLSAPLVALHVLTLVSAAASAGPLPSIGEPWLPADVDRDRPVYRSGFESPAVLDDWLLEGGEAMRVEEGRLVLTSRPKGVAEIDENHLVCWLRREVPGDFLLEFAVRPQNRKEGLNIVFFNARGRRGESIFDPGLRPRNGYFAQYHSGDLDNYHLSYWAAGRGTANLRKNHGFTLVHEGRDLVTGAEPEAFQTIRLHKRGGRVILTVDGLASLAYDDDGRTHGPVWTHSGWLGLRQMAHTVRCEYDNLAVYPLR